MRDCPVIQCADGSLGGCLDVCERDPATGACGWVYRECPAGPCDADGCEPGRCRWDSDCPAGSHCEGSSVCPRGSVCIWEGEPGTCVPDDTDTCTDEACGPQPLCATYQCWDGSWAGCTGQCSRDAATGTCGWEVRACPPEACSIDECGPPPPCGAPLQCADGSIAGCSCERDAASGACGWISHGCPDPGRSCGERECPEGTYCCNPLESLCVPEGSDIACAY